MPLPFRDVPKEGLEIRMPIPLATLLRERAARQRRSIAEVGTMLLIGALERTPEAFGVESPKPAA